MNHSTLAKELRARQISVGLVEKNVINRISDKEIIDCYITCSCCDEKSVSSQEELDKIVLSSKNAEDCIKKTRAAH